MIKIKYSNDFEIFQDYAVVIITSKKYGVFKIKVDLDDFEWIKKYQWNINKCENKKTNKHPLFYAGTNQYSDSNNTTLMHRLIMKAPKGKVVDHINHDFCDNRKCNLRICSQRENLANSNQYYGNKSGVKGVCKITYPSGTQKWKAYIRVNYKFINLGFFDDIKDATKARQDAEEKYIDNSTKNAI